MLNGVHVFPGGYQTLAIRIDRAQENAMKIAQFLQAHPAVSWIKYPGLASHPQYELAKKQMHKPTGLLSVRLKTNERTRIAYRHRNRVNRDCLIQIQMPFASSTVSLIVR